MFCMSTCFGLFTGFDVWYNTKYRLVFTSGVLNVLLDVQIYVL